MNKRYKLKNGIRVVLEKIPHFHSVSIGFWVKIGSLYETNHNNGMSHFIEHMLFKGTDKKNSKEIAQTIDAVGGQLNAFTAKEYTCYYSKLIDENFELGFNLLYEMLFNSIFDSNEIEKEKGVIIEEILMYEDSPEDLVYDQLAKTYFGNHPLGQPILGNISNIESFNRSEIYEFYNDHYIPENIVISIAGNFDEEYVQKVIYEKFEDMEPKGKVDINIPEVKPVNSTIFTYKDIEQVHLCIGLPSIGIDSTDFYPLLILNNIIGGGMSSRLFQKIREDRGLTYSVYSYPSTYNNTGVFSIYASMNPSQAITVCDLITEEILNFKINKITNDEFKMARNQLKGNYILGMESTSSRMSSMGKNELLLDKQIGIKDVISKIDRLSIEDVFLIIDKLLNLSSKTISIVARDDLSDQINKSLIF